MRPHPAIFSEVLILKGVKVPCFHTLLEVMILKELRMPTSVRSTQSSSRRWKGALLLVGRRKFAKLGYGGGDEFEGEGDVAGSGVAAEAKADGGAGFFGRQ